MSLAVFLFQPDGSSTGPSSDICRFCCCGSSAKDAERQEPVLKDAIADPLPDTPPQGAAPASQSAVRPTFGATPLSPGLVDQEAPPDPPKTSVDSERCCCGSSAKDAERQEPVVKDAVADPLPDTPPQGAAPASQGAARTTFGATRLSLGLLYLTTVMLFADQNLMAPNLSQIADEFGYDEVERDVYLGGYVSLFFFLVGAPASVLIGALADCVHRMNLLVATVWIGEVSCLLTFFIEKGSLPQLLACRAMTGVAMGGAIPVLFSILGDIYPPERRAVASMYVLIAGGVGVLAGQTIAGTVGPRAGWRWPFVIVAAPSLLLSLVLRAVVREPMRGAAEVVKATGVDGKYVGKITWVKAKALLRLPSNILLFAQGAIGCLPWGVVFIYMTDFLAQDKGLGVGGATLVVLAFGGGCAVGAVMSGYATQWVYNNSPRLVGALIAVTTSGGSLPMMMLTNWEYDSSLAVLLVILSFIAGALVAFAGPAVRMICINVNLPETRGLALGLLSQVEDVGKAGGPALVALLIATFGRMSSFNIAWICWIACAVCQGAFTLTMLKDEARVQRHLEMEAAGGCEQA